MDGFSLPRYHEMTPEEMDKNEKAYLLTQKQRAFERDVRSAKLESAALKAAGLDGAEMMQTADALAKNYEAWCRENNISAKKFYYWQRRLRAALTGETTPDAPNFQPLSIAKKNTIVELPTPIITPVTTIAPVVLHLNGYTVEINNDATPELITTIMKVISYAQ